MVRLENIGKRYDGGAETLQDISLRLEPGGFYFLTGASGAGKTTLLRIVCLAERPSRGVLTLFDCDIATASRATQTELRRRIGIVFQDFRLVPHLSVFDNVAELLDWLQIADKVEARPATLSGGEQQRVAIARAIVRRPDLLVADEPTGNVDQEMAELLVRVFERINLLGATVLVATHDIAFARQFEHRRLHLDRGRLAGSRGPLFS